MRDRSMSPIVLGALAGLLVLAAGTVRAHPGKFTIVGMGTSPDLLTLRGAEVVRQADIILLDEPEDRNAWAALIGSKEVWFCGRRSAAFYGSDPGQMNDPAAREEAVREARVREVIVQRIRRAVESGKKVAALKWGDPMMFENTYYLEMLPQGFPSEVVPGVGSFQAASAALKMSPCYGGDTNSVILTATDWPGRSDCNEELMGHRTTMVFYAMHLDYPRLFEQLGRHYPPDTPVAVVTHAGDRSRERVIRSTVARFLAEVSYAALPPEETLLLVGKFLEAGQARRTPPALE
ncbi:MAG: SAM-dependent methyltransferase [bacterium]